MPWWEPHARQRLELAALDLCAAELARGAFVTRRSMHAVLQGLAERGHLTPHRSPAGQLEPLRAGRADS